MKTNQREIFLYYNPGTSIGKKTLAIAKSMTPYVNAMDITKISFTGTIWRSLLSKIQISAKHLLDKSHPYYQQHIKGSTLDEQDWINILIHNPELINKPIAIRGTRGMAITSPTDLMRLDNYPESGSRSHATNLA